jgi:regulator of protease activity HflC (stomatin/prohibitin superfamily)
MQAGRLVFVALYGVTLLAAWRWGVSNVQQVSPDRRAVVLRMGALSRVQSAGLLLAWPRPFEQVVMLPSAESVTERRVETLLRSARASQADISGIDAEDTSGSSADTFAGSGFLLTGDAGIVQLDVRVFYRVSKPFDFVLQGEHVQSALDRVVTRSAVAVCAGRDLDTILVARPELVSNDSNVAQQREQLRSDLVRTVNQTLAALQAEGLGIGIEVVRADVQSSLPATTVSAFNAVLTASQQTEKSIADARTGAAWEMQTATQNADRTLQVAQAQATERVAKSEADTLSMKRLAESGQGQGDPGLLLRIYRERIPAILSKAGSVITVNPKDDSRLIIQGAEK